MDQQGEAAQLTARQRARMADVSLLLDVILKTSSTRSSSTLALQGRGARVKIVRLTECLRTCSTKREFCNCGILRQLQIILSRCTSGAAYSVIVKKVLRAIEHLPLTAENFHQHSSAHGSFSDTLWTLGGHNDYEASFLSVSNRRTLLQTKWQHRSEDVSTMSQIRNKARTLRDKFPLEACSKEVQEAARTARAAVAARRARHVNGHSQSRRRHHDLPYSSSSADRSSRPYSGRQRSSRFHGSGETPGGHRACSFSLDCRFYQLHYGVEIIQPVQRETDMVRRRPGAADLEREKAYGATVLERPLLTRVPPDGECLNHRQWHRLSTPLSIHNR